MRVTAQEGIRIVYATEIGTDGHILDRTFMLAGLFGFIPGAFVLFPWNCALRRCQINVHVGPIEFSDQLVHPLLLTRKHRPREDANCAFSNGRTHQPSSERIA